MIDTREQLPPFVIAVDSREQRPLIFGSWPTQIVGIKTGDYSIVGFQDEIALERKELSDLFACVGRERERFERELERLGALDYGALVIEATLAEVLAGCPRSEVAGRAAVGSLLAWSIDYKLPVWLAGDRRHAAAVVLKLLSKWHKRHVAEVRSDER